MTLRAFLFDLDGVLTDTSEFHYLAWQRLADEEGLPFSRADNDNLRGVSRRQSLNVLLKGKEISEEMVEAWMARKNRYYVELVENMDAGMMLPGALELLKEVRSANLKIAVASVSKNAPQVIDRLQIRKMIDALVDGNMVTNSKPAPDLFLKAAEILNISPKECLVIEDAAAGIDAGKAAGMHTLGLGPHQRVGHADLVLPDLDGVRLSDILQKLHESPLPK